MNATGLNDETRDDASGMTALRAVLWDMDGTLIDSEPYWHQAEMDIAREHGGSWSEALGWECSGKALPVVASRMIEHGTRLSSERIAQGLIESVARQEAERMPWIEGVEDVLRSLAAAGIPSVLVTASPRRMAENLLRQAPEGVFVGYVCGDDDLPKKPDPAPYLAAAKVVGIEVPGDGSRDGVGIGADERSGVGGGKNAADDGEHDDVARRRAFRREMARCVAIEDSMTGIESAAASGATTIAQTGFIDIDTSTGPQFASVDGYAGLTAASLERYVTRRLRVR
ncbi:HAD family hydrolase [Bifidobacterium sp. ESL0763]|uniref:HAD family hydrolase n=1 Tax=Bifidobacterium sp. ESL0763 TaxID=2983227 RepID=UPI0023F9B5EF|nr:HAD family hydrolase [Bifidobacterium sp. ESL0763]MDF7663222.1 HAD family hydrolase [Bifidobacterium sp. ESL0763]